MKLTSRPDLLKYLTLGAGGLGLALRVILYTTGIDGRNLLETGHWAHIALWVLTFAVVGIIFTATRSLEGSADPASFCPMSYAGSLGAFAAMVGIGITTVSEFAEFSNSLHLLVWALGIGATISLGCIGICRLMGKQPHFLCNVVLCLYFALRMVSQYQMWSSDPQLQDYCFYLISYVALMLTAYHHGAFGADMGSHKQLWRFSLGAVYFICLSLNGGIDTFLMLGCGAWAITNLTSLQIHPRRQRPALNWDETETPKTEE